MRSRPSGRLLDIPPATSGPRAALAAIASVLTIALVGHACSRHPESADASAPFRGRTVRLIVSYAAGGGYDLSARVLAEFLGRHLAGSPAVVVDNMPGAGGLLAASYLAHQAAPDGLVVGLLGAGAVLPQVLDDPGVQYDIRLFKIVGAVTSEKDYVCVGRRENGIDLDGWRSRAGGAVLGTPGRGASGHVQAALLASALHLPVRFVTGYRGSADLRLALDGGEIDLMCMQLGNYRLTVEPTGRYAVVLQSGEHPLLLEQGVPSATRLVQDARGREWLELREAFVLADRFYVAPPETPAPLVQALRRAFDDTMNDEAYLAAARTARLETGTVPPDDFARQLSRLIDLPPERRDAVKKLVAAGGLP